MEINLEEVSEPDVEAAWSEEIRRRLAEVDAGTTELSNWEDVRAELFDQRSPKEQQLVTSEGGC
jgi:hypothetical protein